MDADATKSAQEYLKEIRRTIAESKRMVESVKLRIAETDRMLAESGTSREEVAKFTFTPGQIAAVHEELRRRGMRLPDGADAGIQCGTSAVPHWPAANADVPESMDNRRMKFGAMMKQIRM